MKIRTYRPEDETAVIALWKECDLVVPHNNPHRDIQRKLIVNPDLLIVGELDGLIVAAVMAGYDGHRGWLNYLAVSPSLQHTGLGRQIVAEAENRLRARGCPKVNLQVRKSNKDVVKFYQKLGFIEDRVVSMGKRLERD